MRPLHGLACVIAVATSLPLLSASLEAQTAGQTLGQSLGQASGKPAEFMIDGVPMPQDAAVQTPSVAILPQAARYSGAWTGSWDDTLKHLLIVEKLTSSSDATVIYAIGANPMLGIVQQWHRFPAKIEDGVLKVTGPTATMTYEVTGTGRLRALYDAPDVRADAVMSPVDLRALKANKGVGAPWTAGTREWLVTGQTEGGKPVRLQAFVYAPPGTGPFPLAVLNHGAAGDGANPGQYNLTWSPSLIAEALNERGYIVAFPQRRGRGGSEGLYDEGMESDRKLGYSCNATRTLAGADRALDDVDAAVRALRRRPDVAPGRILMGGQSRGGALAIAYAGQRSDQVAGVINFVGGWVGDDCPDAKTINGKMFSRGGSFSGHTLWLYGHRDTFYTMAHSRGNFTAFQKAGGHGTFIEAQVPGAGNVGHYVGADPSVWETPLSAFLDIIADRGAASELATGSRP